MEYIDLYDKITNPLDNPEVLQKVVQAYINSNKRGSFYSNLVRCSDKIGDGRYYVGEADKFYSSMFNLWKNSIISMTKEEFKELYKKGAYGNNPQGFIILREYLKTLKDVTTKEEANKIMHEKKESKELDNAMDKYRWTAFGEGTGWIHVKSRILKAKKEEDQDIGHRLYINIESLDIYKVLNSFTEKCLKENIPFYFKFNQYCDRDESIVIYSSTEYLNKYLEILERIKKENKEVVQNAKEPPVLTGVIDGWIGYGSEPADRNNGCSFNDLRANILDNAITKTTVEWILLNYQKEVTVNGKRISFENYFASEATNYFIKQLSKRIELYTPKEAVEKFGYSSNDLNNEKIRENIFRLIKNKMGDNLIDTYNIGIDKVKPIQMEVRNNKKIEFSNEDLKNVLKNKTEEIVKHTPNYIYGVKKNIKSISPIYGVDPEKFCFDFSRAKDLKEYDKSKKELEEMLEKTDEIRTPRQRLYDETDEEYENYLRDFYESKNTK